MSINETSQAERGEAVRALADDELDRVSGGAGLVGFTFRFVYPSAPPLAPDPTRLQIDLG